jgi:membrane protein DedA with SNARE-associated domain
MHHFFDLILTWYQNHLTYWHIMLCMGIESTFLPLPSELIIPPAAMLAAQGNMNVFLVVLYGTLGALLGSLFNYFFALTLGRKVIYALADTKLAKLIFINGEKVKKAEDYFIKNGRSSTFIGRLVPGIRHLISIPAGLAKMPLKDFVLYTALGAGFWNIILAIVGYFLYQFRDQIFHYLSYILLALGAGFTIYLIWKAVKKNGNSKK